MKRTFITLTVCLLLPSLMVAQKGTRPWEKGPLTWNDFTVVNKSIGEEHSYLEFFLAVEDREQKVGSYALPAETAVAMVDREHSWVDSAHRTPAQLRYNQVLFNIVELHRRNLQIAIDTGGRVNMDYSMRLLTHEADSFCRATNYGNDTAEVLWWEQSVRRQLDSVTPLMVERHTKAYQIERLRPNGSFGMAMGLGTKFFFGDIHRLFAPSAGVYFDFFGGGGGHVFDFGFYVGGGRCKPDSITTVRPDNKLYWNDDIMTLDLHVDYGYSVISNHRLTLTPFVGYGLQGVYYSTSDEGASGGPSEGCWRVGLDAQYDLSSSIGGSSSNLTLFGIAVQGKVYVCFDRFRSIVGNPHGLTLNTQVGFSLRGRDMKVVRPAVKKGDASPAVRTHLP